MINDRITGHERVKGASPKPYDHDRYEHDRGTGGVCVISRHSSMHRHGAVAWEN